MRHVVLLGAATLLALLTALMLLEPVPTGKATTGTSVNVSNSSPVTCVTPLGAGINIVSISCATTAEPVGQIFNGSDYWAAYQYVPGEPDAWRVHNPNLPSYVVSDLSLISRRTGYVVLMNDSRVLSHQGARAVLTNVPLVTGWNLVGYPSTIIQNASDSFLGLPITEARTYNLTQGTYVRYRNTSADTLNRTEVGAGYWMNATQAATWGVMS